MKRAGAVALALGAGSAPFWVWNPYHLHTLIMDGIFAILALSLSTACLNGAEGPFFMTATAIGVESPGAAAGMLNLMGNLGGVLSIWLVPRMSGAWGWNGTLVFWSGVCVAAALLWLTVEQP